MVVALVVRHVKYDMGSGWSRRLCSGRRQDIVSARGLHDALRGVSGGHHGSAAPGEPREPPLWLATCRPLACRPRTSYEARALAQASITEAVKASNPDADLSGVATGLPDKVPLF